MVETLVIARIGRPTLQVRVIRINARRRGQVARTMAGLGFPSWRIRKVTGLSIAGLARALAARRSHSIWGGFAEQIRAELRVAA